MLAQSLIFVVASATAVAFFTAVRMPPVVGYLLAGLALGRSGLGLVEAGDGIDFLAELGLIFLMFMVGLEFSIPTILAARREVLVAGGLQVGLTMALTAVGLTAAGVETRAAIVLSGAVAMSSTAVTLKQLAEQGEVSSSHGRLALGILLFQDVATLPLLITVDAWSAGGAPVAVDIARQTAIAILALAAAAFVIRPLVHVGLSGVLRTRSSDLFLLTVLMLALGTAYAVHLAGLAAPIGAFVAGMVIGETDFRYRVEEDIRPFRDALVGLFFVTVGMGIDVSIIAGNGPAVLLWVFALLVVKAVLAFVAGLPVIKQAPAAARSAVILAHGGEFGLLLITLALGAGIVTSAEGQPLLVGLAATMGLAPLIIERNHWAERLFGLVSLRMTATEATIRAQSDTLQDHVILCGCGRIGRLVAKVLGAAEIPYIAIEYDLARFRAARRQGHEVVFGDARHRRILEAAGIDHARLLVMTFDRRNAVERILHHVRESGALPSTLVSAADDRDAGRFTGLGVTAVFPENLAAGLGLADQALLLCGKTQNDARKIITAIRTQLTPELKDMVGI